MNTNEPTVTTGNVQCSDERVAFVREGFKFTFVRTGGEAGISKIVLEADENGYIYGMTHNNKPIAIYTRDNVELLHSAILNTNNYIIANQNLQELLTAPSQNISSAFRFKGIQFTNGPIRSVNTCHALYEEYRLEDKLKAEAQIEVDSEAVSDSTTEKRHPKQYYVYSGYPQHKKFNLKDNGEDVSWNFGSIVHQKLSLDEGRTLENTDSYLRIDFENFHRLGSFYNYYGYVTAVMSFLTFRADLAFDKVLLMTEHPKGGMIEFAKCYIRTEEKIAKRSMMNVLSINLLTEDMFRNLVYSEMDTVSSKNTIRLPVAIIPKNDSDVFLISTNRIRDICSSLEVEIDAAGIKLSKNQELNCLIKGVKRLVKWHRKGRTGVAPLPQKTYESIFSNISHWGDAAADRAIVAWHNHQKELAPFICTTKIEVNDTDIAELVKTRNNITHRGFRDFSPKDANTATAMIALIYCLTLERIGLSHELIEDLMMRRLIG